ncbi:MAG: TIGR03986 family CRISPR-associated RAMP protein [Gammaproteobacteria bacterium]|nr:TIGR03986 family CRISPR-associated RAMP protein [Gammaproteobacteria bacterium]
MAVHAPYNFVPLSAWIFKPAWGHQVSHDLPFSDGICGILTLKIHTHTPLLVGGRQQEASEKAPGEVHFYQTPEKQYAIPGSSIKGMIRNVLEIAAFGKMRKVDDRALSVRDLTKGGEFYRQCLTKDQGDRTYEPRAKAGWLKLTRDEKGQMQWQLAPCCYVRVEQNDLIALAGRQGIQKAEGIKQKQSAVKKYTLWGEKNLELHFGVEGNKKWRHQRGKITLIYDKAKSSLGTGDQKGTIVFTGQPGDNKDKGGANKHMEFIFYRSEAQPKILDEELARRFREIHADSEEWKYWNPKLRNGEAIPVFYLQQGSKIQSLGLAMMYRLAYKHSIAETIAHTNPGHMDDQGDDNHSFDPKESLRADNRLYDLPELLFGAVNEKKTDFSLRSRVSFAAARLEGKAEEDKSLPVTVLNGPKPSYYPAYVRQPAEEKLKENQAYRTYMDDNAEVRGWKRYPAQPRWKVFTADEAGGGRVKAKSEKAKIKLFPLKKGASFTSAVTLHNLRPMELGALAWALIWGGKKHLRHGLGMGKPYGLGQISIEISAADLFFVNPEKAEKPDIAKCLQDFVQCMEDNWLEAKQAHGSGAKSVSWTDSEQLTRLRAMADPGKAEPEKSAYMGLPQFQREKNNRSVLPSYGQYHGVADTELFPRMTRAERERREYEAQKQREAKIREEKVKEELKQFKTATERDLYKDLHLETNRSVAETNAVEWLRKMEQADSDEARLIADKLKEFYQSIGKWTKPAKKQKEKVQRIKVILNNPAGAGL